MKLQRILAAMQQFWLEDIYDWKVYSYQEQRMHCSCFVMIAQSSRHQRSVNNDKHPTRNAGWQYMHQTIRDFLGMLIHRWQPQNLQIINTMVSKAHSITMHAMCLPVSSSLRISSEVLALCKIIFGCATLSWLVCFIWASRAAWTGRIQCGSYNYFKLCSRAVFLLRTNDTKVDIKEISPFIMDKCWWMTLAIWKH